MRQVPKLQNTKIFFENNVHEDFSKGWLIIAPPSPPTNNKTQFIVDSDYKHFF